MISIYAFRPTETSSRKAEAEKREPSKVEAWAWAQVFVEEKLKAPSSASYGGIFSGDLQHSDDVVTDSGGGEYVVNAWVDSQNSFGAQIRTHFFCVLEVHDGNWSCKSAEFSE